MRLLKAILAGLTAAFIVTAVLDLTLHLQDRGQDEAIVFYALTLIFAVVAGSVMPRHQPQDQQHKHDQEDHRD